MPIRSLNYTGRWKIPRETITIAREHAADGRSLRVRVRPVSEAPLPVGTRVILEPYDAHFYADRFDLGVYRGGDLDKEVPLRGAGASVDFRRVRLKFTDERGLIRAHAVVELMGEEECAAPSRSILSIRNGNAESMGDLPYRFVYEYGEGSLLEVHPDVGPWRQVARHPAFRSLVFPQVLREGLIETARRQSWHLEDDTDEQLQKNWIRFAVNLQPDMPSDGEEETREWIETVVKKFCARHGLLKTLRSFMEEE